MHGVALCVGCLALSSCRHCWGMWVVTTWLGGTVCSAMAASRPAEGRARVDIQSGSSAIARLPGYKQQTMLLPIGSLLICFVWERLGARHGDRDTDRVAENASD